MPVTLIKMIISVKCRIHGKVQGVWFRDSTRRTALQLGISGSAVNMPDGSVEVIASGSQQQIEQLKNWLKHGPELARVDAMSCVAYNPKIKSGFIIA